MIIYCIVDRMSWSGLKLIFVYSLKKIIRYIATIEAFLNKAATQVVP